MEKINQHHWGFLNGLGGGMVTGFLSFGVLEYIARTPTQRLAAVIALPICGLLGTISGVAWDGTKNAQSEAEEILNRRLGERFSVEMDDKSAYAQLKGLRGINLFTVDLKTGSAALARGHIEHLLYHERVKTGRMSSRMETRTENKKVWDDTIPYEAMNNLQKNVVDVMRSVLAVGRPLPRQSALQTMDVETSLLRYLNSEMCVPLIEVSEQGEVLISSPRPPLQASALEPAQYI